MIVSHKHRFIFIHVPRCGGTALTLGLLPHLHSNDIVLGCTSDFQKISEENRAKGKLWKHSSASKAKSILGDNIWNSYYKFAFVRNPWEWQLSIYFYILTHEIHPLHQKIKSMNGYADYIKSDIFTNWDNSLLQYISDSAGKIVVDYVGKYENLVQEFNFICKTINLASVKLSPTHFSFHKHYSNYYNHEIKRIIAEKHKKDIEIFAYKFEKFDLKGRIYNIEKQYVMFKRKLKLLLNGMS